MSLLLEEFKKILLYLQRVGYGSCSRKEACSHGL